MLVAGVLFAASGCGPAPDEVAFVEAEQALASGEHDRALTLYNVFLKQYPGSKRAPESLYKVAHIYNRHLRNTKNSIDTYALLLHLYPESPHAMLAREDRAELYANIEEPRKAIEEYTWLLQNAAKTNEDKYRYSIAMQYMEMRDLRQARIELEELIKNKPGTRLAPKAYLQIATTYYLEGKLASAIESYDRVIKKFSKEDVVMQAMLGKAKALEESGRLLSALSVLEKLSDQYPNSAVIKIRAVNIRERIKRRPGVKK